MSPSIRAARAANSRRIVAVPILALLAGATMLLAAFPFPLFPAAEDKPAFVMEEYCSTFAFAPDNRIAIGVYRVYNHKKYTLEGDDLWIASPDGKRTRIIEGAKLVKVDKPQSFTKSMTSPGRPTAKSSPSSKPPSTSPAIKTRSPQAI